MSEITSHVWKSNSPQFAGSAYKSPATIYEDFMELIHTYTVLGKLHSAEQLKARITPELCENYAPLLSVLYELSEFSPRTTEPVLDSSKTNNTEETTDVATFSFSDTDPNEGISELSDLSDYEEADSNVSGGSQNDDPMYEEAAMEQAIQFEDIVRFSNSQHIIMDDVPRDSLSENDLINMLKILLQGYTCDEVLIKGLSDVCSKSIWFHFTELKEEIDNLTLFKTKEHVLSSIRDIKCKTLIQFMCECEKIMNRIPKVEITGLENINNWLSGDLAYPFIVELEDTSLIPANYDANLALKEWMKGNSLFDDAIYSNFVVSPELHHPELYKVMLYSYVLNQGFNAPVDIKLTWVSYHQYSKQLYELSWSLRNKLEVSHGLKSEIMSAWSTLSAIYLAQDARVLKFLNAWVVERNFSQNLRGIVIPLIESVWNDEYPPFTLNQKFEPILTKDITMHPCLELWLGKNYSKIFNPKRLKDLWKKVVNAFLTGNQLTELELRETTQQVRHSIDEDCFSRAL